VKQFLADNKYWIIGPALVLAVLWVSLILLTEGQSVAPFVYSIF
jgi:Family of unknown function (DUF5989)